MKINKLFASIFIMYSCSVLATEVEYNAEKLVQVRDPFKLPESFESDEQAVMDLIEKLSSGLQIKGVALSAASNYIIIDEKIVSEGDIWNKLMIEKIFPDKILLRYEDKIKELIIKQREENDE